MFDEKSITPGLAELGYLHLKKRTYKASWSSTEVEHFLFLSLYGGGNYFVCEFGIRNPPAERATSTRPLGRAAIAAGRCDEVCAALSFLPGRREAPL